jgi:hypothetical protein
VLMILLGANLCSDDVATSPSQPAGIQGGGGVARHASCRGRSEWHCGLWLGASRNVASALFHVCVETCIGITQKNKIVLL